MSETGEYLWPTASQWDRMKPAKRTDRALRLLVQAVRQERRGPESPATIGSRSPAIRQALALADEALSWRRRP